MVKKELDHVDMCAKLKSVWLDAFFGHDAWPPALAVNLFRALRGGVVSCVCSCAGT